LDVSEEKGMPFTAVVRDVGFLEEAKREKG